MNKRRVHELVAPVGKYKRACIFLFLRSLYHIKFLNNRLIICTYLELFYFILEDIRQLKKLLSEPQNLDVIMAAMDASSWRNEFSDTPQVKKTQRTRFPGLYQTIGIF